MLNLLTSKQTREVDSHTISTKPISSIDLMEEASRAFVNAFRNEFADKTELISIYCGTGNNGGDGLAVARMLKEDGYVIHVIVARFTEKSSIEFETNLKKLSLTGISILEISDVGELPEENSNVIIDALLGSGLNKALEGELKKIVDYLNSLQKTIVSIDVPTGLPTEGTIDLHASVIKAKLVITFQRPKINFFFPESAIGLERFIVVDIGLDEKYIEGQITEWKLIEAKDISIRFRPRKNFSHKGTFGNALIVAGSQETMGAALLCVDACLHTGAGITTAYIPKKGLISLNTRIPEAVAYLRNKDALPTKSELIKYQSIAVGSGLGKSKSEIKLVKFLLKEARVPMVLDADALNIIADNPLFLRQLPINCILTPHLKEFDRLFGTHTSWLDRIKTAQVIAIKHQIIILLKNKYSFIILPNGKVLINPTGNPAMAVGGMGDVLTGMIASFLAQGYKAEDAAILGCYLHGKTGDVLKEEKGMNSIPPRYIIEKLPEIILKSNS